MSATLIIGGVDVSSVAPYAATVQTGRDNIDSQPDASVLEVTVHGWRPAGKLSDAVTLSDEHGTLFHGIITDIGAQLEPGTAHGWTTRVIAVGPLADLGRTVIGDEPWPVETDSQRVKRILDLAGAGHAVNPAINGPNLLGTDVDRRPALELAQESAADALGVLWEQPADTATPIRYTPQRLRAWQAVAPAWSELPAAQTWDALPTGMTWDSWTTEHYSDTLTTPSLTLSAGRVIADVTLSQQIGDLIRKVRVIYGPDVEQGDRAQETAGDGTPELALDTRIADQPSAALIADNVWRARREPAWRMSQATVRLSDLPPAEHQHIRDALAVGTKLTLTDIDFESPIGATWEGYIEGWTHELIASVHKLTLRLVDRRLIEPSNRWQDLDAGLQWQQIDPLLTWADAVGGFQ